jgi:hypothetical protein
MQKTYEFITIAAVTIFYLFITIYSDLAILLLWNVTILKWQKARQLTCNTLSLSWAYALIEYLQWNRLLNEVCLRYLQSL